MADQAIVLPPVLAFVSSRVDGSELIERLNLAARFALAINLRAWLLIVCHFSM
jgi:hypothetical protein